MLNKLSPLNVLDIEYITTPNRGMPIIREANGVYPLLNLRRDVRKSCIAIFICEVLQKSIREVEANEALFAYLTSAIQLLDSVNEGIENFHLHFLANFCKIMGFMPKDNFAPERPYFNFSQGEYSGAYNQELCFTLEESRTLHSVLATPVMSIEAITGSGEGRNRFLERMLQYLSYHTGSRLTLKSLEVLREIFSFTA